MWLTAAGTHATNTSVIYGGKGATLPDYDPNDRTPPVSGSDGGAGVRAAGGTLVNSGLIYGGDPTTAPRGGTIGGAGSTPTGGTGGSGGAGVVASGNTSISNTGWGFGGIGGSQGAAGLTGPGSGAGGGGRGGHGAVLTGSSLTNQGPDAASPASVRGGIGGDGGSRGNGGPGYNGDGNGYDGGAGGAGGNGASLSGQSNLQVATTSTLQGGTGGAGGTCGAGFRPGGQGGSGGAGGRGATVVSSTLTNLGVVKGGDGGALGSSGTCIVVVNPGDANLPGPGGAAVVADGGATTITAGTLAGGFKAGSTAEADRAAAIELHNGGNTLELRQGYVITGRAVSDSGTANGGDTLAFGGTASFIGFDLGSVYPEGKYSGFNRLLKRGTGTWQWWGNGTLITASTQVTEGTLQVDGTLGNSPVTVSAGRLTGTGRVGALANAASVAPGTGQPSGTLTAATFTQNSAGTLTIAAGGANATSARLAVTGAATLGGTLAMGFAATPAPALGQRYTVLTAASLGGSFSNVTASNVPTGLRAVVDYGTTTANAVTVTIATATYTVTPGVNGGNGTISPSTAVTVNHGATQVFTLAPATGYRVDTVTGTCGGALSGADNTTYTTHAVTANCTVIARFARQTYTVGGNVTGLLGSGLSLRLNGGNDLAITGNGSFTFGQPLDDGSNYTVTIAQQPGTPSQTCAINGGSGTVSGANVTGISVNCAAPQALLRLSVSDDRAYARYGMMLDYVVTLTNDGDGNATDVSLTHVVPPQLDAEATTWVCEGAGNGAICTASGSGALADSGIVLPAGRSLSWIVSSPVRLDASGGHVAFTVDAVGTGSPTATDEDTLVLLRTGMDEVNGDGAEGDGVDGPAAPCPATAAAAEAFDLATPRTLVLPLHAAHGGIDTLLAARAGNGAAYRLQRIDTPSTPRVRLLVTEASGRERATAWTAATPGDTLVIAVEAADDRSVLLLEGQGVSLQSTLPPGMDASTNAQPATPACQP